MTDTRDSAAAAMTSAAPPSLADAVGGPLGVAESALPAAAFVLTYTVSGQDTRAALVAAVALGVLFALARIVRGQTVAVRARRARLDWRSQRTSSRARARPRTSSSPACSRTPATRSPT